MPSERRFEAVLFDMDGVVADTEDLHVRSEQETCVDYNFKVDPNDWGGFKGQTAASVVSYLIQKYGDPAKHNVDELISHKTEIFLGLAEQELREIEGAIMFINWSRKQFEKTALVTSSNSLVQNFITSKLGVADLFDVTVTGDDVENGKPHPEPYFKALRSIGVSARKALVVEDSISGIRSAHAAGCEVMAVTTSHTAEELEQESPLHIFEDYSQARAYLFNWYG